jgi:hypothetical protein
MAMTTLDDFARTFSPAGVRSVPSFWQRLTSSLESHRRREANEYIAEYLRRHPEYQNDVGRLNRGVR